jgi:serine/threonine protein phosphatase PrpC
MIRCFHRSEPGGHAANEDAFEVRQHPDDPECVLCVIADGQGGQAGGAAAAQVACQTCLAAAVSYSVTELLHPATWARMFQAADRAVADHPAAGYTTLAGFCIANERLCGASNGDSAVLLLSADAPGDVLTSRQYKNPPVGSGAAACRPFSARLARPWLVLAMTDGVWKFVGWDEVTRIASENRSELMVDLLRERAGLRRGGGLQDDFTVVVLLDG